MHRMITSEVGPDGLRDCFRDPIPQIFEAAALLADAASAHLRGDRKKTEELLRAADMPIIGEWLDPIWSGQNNIYRAIRKVAGLPPILPKADRAKPRQPTAAMKKALIKRDGFHCRLCGIPLVRAEVRRVFTRLYPEAARWTGTRANEQHRGLQVTWLQYDHVIVHSRGGETSIENLVVTCPACNFGRDRYMMSEVGLRDPRSYPRSPTWTGWQSWDGLEQLLPQNERCYSALAECGAFRSESAEE
jgi:5-methylcytosine-specific restriction endonuclease McrA